MAMTVTNNLNTYAANNSYATGNAKPAAESKKADETVKAAESKKANETVKATESKKADATAKTAGNKKYQNDKAAEYYSYLQKNYDCVRNGKVSISGSHLKACANDPEKAKQLESELAFYKESYESGRKSAGAYLNSLGDKLVSYEETWAYDSKGNLTMITQTVGTHGDPAKEAAEKKAAEEEKAKKKQAKKLAEKKAEEKQAEKKADRKKEEEKLMEKLGISKEPMTAVTDAYHMSFDKSV